MPGAPRPAPLAPGDPAPWFVARTSGNPQYHFETVAGRCVVLCFFESAADPLAARVLEGFGRAGATFDDTNACFFGVSEDPEDERLGRVADRYPGYRMFWDFAAALRAAYGVSGIRCTIVLDRLLRAVAVLPFGADPEGHVAAALQAVRGAVAAPPPACAPVLVAENVFEPAFCRRLIACYEEQGGEDSGYMKEIDGRTVGHYDYRHKRRRDCTLADKSLRDACAARVRARLNPLVERAFCFRPTRMERYIVSCYDAAEQAHFKPHRDNTTRGTAHRRFAVSLFLNTGEYEGGDLRFPEFGPGAYSAPAGGAVVFSCSLLHEALPVTRGRRFMFLPFLYDEAAAALRERNDAHLEETRRGYRAVTKPPSS